MEHRFEPGAGRSSSFACEIPLTVSTAQEKALLARLEAARQIYNACLGEALRRLALLRQSKPYRVAICLPKGAPGRNVLFATAKGKCGFKDAALQHYAGVLRRSWIGDHLDVHTTQKLATRAFRAVERILLRKARKVRFKGPNQIDTVESKSNLSGIRWRENHVAWNGLVLPVVIDRRDPVIAHALSCRVKYVRLVRRKVRGKNLFYAQLVCEGHEFPTRSTKLSRTCHCGSVYKKPLSQRWHRCSHCGASAQRDLYSAFLARFVDPETGMLHAGRAHEAWPGAEPLLRAAWRQAAENQPASGRALPSSFGANRSRSGLPAQGRIAKAKARDAVAYPKGDGESPEEAAVVLPRTLGL